MPDLSSVRSTSKFAKASRWWPRSGNDNYTNLPKYCKDYDRHRQLLIKCSITSTTTPACSTCMGPPLMTIPLPSKEPGQGRQDFDFADPFPTADKFHIVPRPQSQPFAHQFGRI